MLKPGPFTPDDFDTISSLAVAAWTAGVERDWSVPAGTLEWSCLETADHVIDSVYSYAFWLATRDQEAHPYYGEVHARDGLGPASFVQGLRAVTTMLSSVIHASPEGTRAFIWGRPTLETGDVNDFAARGGLELVQHAHDVASGVGVDFQPPADVCRRLIEHTESWPWHSPIERTDDAWSDLLVLTGRPGP